MPLDTQRQEEPGTPPALRLANAWADFTNALSIYIVSSRCPLTLMTSSTRPMIQK